MGDPSPNNDFVSKAQFDEYKNAIAERLKESSDRELRNFKAIFEKLEAIRGTQIEQTGNITQLTKKLEESVQEDNFNTLCDKRLTENKILNADQIKLQYVPNDERYESLIKISWLGKGIVQWVLGGGVGVTLLIGILQMLFGD